MTRLLILFTTASLLFMSAQATLAASVTITPVAAGTYSVQGDAMDGVAGIDLKIIYDTLSLSSPTVSQGSLVTGALMAANINNPGSIKIAIISTKAFSGSGQIAIVAFASQNGTGGITSASVSMIDSKGSPINAQVVVSGGNATPASASGLFTTPGVPFSQSSAAAATASSTTAAPASSIPTYLGTVSMPVDVQPESDTKNVDTTSVPVQPAKPSDAKPVEPPAEVKPVAEPQKPVDVKMTSHRGVLDYFRAYKGEKSPAIFSVLFNKEITPSIRQEPAVALSDGNTPVTIRVKLETAGDNSPNFSLKGAKLVSLNRDSSFTWIIETLPQAGIVSASLTILTDRDIIEYPLTLAPPVEGVSPSEGDFAVFLTDSGAAVPKRDLNGDGSHDYLDDFIYTANYLMRKGATGKKKISGPALTADTPAPSRAPSAGGKVPEEKGASFTLLALETVNSSKLEPLATKLASSGFQPVVREVNKPVDVYRLITGCFSTKAVAQKSLTALARKEKKVFMVHDADQHCIAAASLFSYDAALNEQNRLAKKAIKAEIVKSQAAITVWQITIGRYNEEKTMAADVNRLKAQGINAIAMPLN